MVLGGLPGRVPRGSPGIRGGVPPGIPGGGPGGARGGARGGLPPGGSGAPPREIRGFRQNPGFWQNPGSLRVLGHRINIGPGGVPPGTWGYPRKPAKPRFWRKSRKSGGPEVSRIGELLNTVLGVHPGRPPRGAAPPGEGVPAGTLGGRDRPLRGYPPGVPPVPPALGGIPGIPGGVPTWGTGVPPRVPPGVGGMPRRVPQ